ncbi:APC family permease [Nocardia tengchongensis]|uniref:APC family permease n=1 Tax=Nocardia tengchongensis TaxID=2055889 RepID=UPI00367CF600
MSVPPVSSNMDGIPSDANSETTVARPAEAPPGLRGRLGVPGLVAAVVAFASPLAAVAGYLAFVIASGNGLGAPVTVSLVGALVLIFSVGYVRMAELVPNPGGFYAYVTAALGKATGLGTGLLTTVGYLVGGFGFYIYGGIVASSAVRDALHGPDIPWWAYMIAFILVVSTLAYRGIDSSVRALSAVMVFEVGIVLVFDLVVALRGGPTGRPLDSFTWHSVASGSVPMAALFGLLLFTGFESTTLFREEVKEPAKTIRRATYISVTLITVLFAASAWCLIVAYGTDTVVGEAQQDPTGIFATAVSNYLGSTMMTVTSVLLVTSIFASQLSLSNSVCRYLFSMGKDGVLAPALGRAHDERHSPHRAAVVLAMFHLVGLVIVLIARQSPSDMFAWSAFAVAIAILASYFLMSVAVFVFFARRRDGIDTAARLLLAGIAVVGFAATLIWALLNPEAIAGQESVFNYLIPIGLLLVTVGGAGYAVLLRVRRPDVYRRIGRQ